ncbi:hypothetical protein BGW39_005527 [Mortierella sp. 14UC]|nr:hypothetical protein BGW39_005527 [Mortierella sp. 14UC]
MAINPDKMPEYSTFLARLLLTPSYTYELIGTTDVIIRLSDITISGIGVLTTITLGGFDGFQALVVVDEPSLVQSGAKGFALTLNLDFKSPSPELTVHFGDVSLQVVHSNGISIGTVVFKHFKTATHITAVMTGDSADAFNVVSGLRTAGDTFTMTGFKGSHKTPGVAGAFAGLKVSLPIPTIKEI